MQVRYPASRLLSAGSRPRRAGPSGAMGLSRGARQPKEDSPLGARPEPSRTSAGLERVRRAEVGGERPGCAWARAHGLIGTRRIRPIQAPASAGAVCAAEVCLRVVQAADEERRRIERDLHDGAQQRLVALALSLRAAQRTAEIVDVEVLAEAVAELELAICELRDLAHGIHPPILTEEGLAAALESLTSRSPYPVALDVSAAGLPGHVEATAYFIASEALANAFKHARASCVAVRAWTSNGCLFVTIEDNGVGGARTEHGSGLRGLAHRAEALAGRLRVESPAGGGTRILAEIPCGS